jgi:hypothetical protein
VSYSGYSDEAIFAGIFAAEGAIPVRWEVASRCDCYSEDTKQPEWGHADCGGFGAVYAPAREVRALFRGQGRWTANRASGEHGLGEAQLTTPLTVKPGYVDERIRDRFTTTIAVGDVDSGRVFYPAAAPVPFLFNGAQRAWRVQLQSADQDSRLKPQP